MMGSPVGSESSLGIRAAGVARIEQGYDPFDYSAPDTAHPLYDRHDPRDV